MRVHSGTSNAVVDHIVVVIIIVVIIVVVLSGLHGRFVVVLVFDESCRGREKTYKRAYDNVIGRTITVFMILTE